jgi:hypothetical protein
MNGKHILLFTALSFPILLFFSCAGLKPAERDLPPEQAVTVPAEIPHERPPEQAATLPPETPRERPPEQAVTLPPEAPRGRPPERPPERPGPPERIMGKGRIPEEKLALFLERNNPVADREFALALAGYYIQEAAFEGVNHDTAFAQMCLETGFLSYGGLVTPEMNNFCGLGSIGPGQSGEIFPDTRTGVRAHIQHLKAYATEEPLNGVLVDPRYRWVRYGSSPTIAGLSGTWAADESYSGKIGDILRRLYDFSFGASLSQN